MLWPVMPFKPVDEAARFGAVKGAYGDAGVMRAQVVPDQHDFPAAVKCMSDKSLSRQENRKGG